MVPLLPDRFLQLLNFDIEQRFPGSAGNGFGRDAFGRKSTCISSISGDRAQSSIGIDHHDESRSAGNRRAENVVDKTPVRDETKHTVQTRKMADDNVIIDADRRVRAGGNARASLAAYGYVVIRISAVLSAILPMAVFSFPLVLVFDMGKAPSATLLNPSTFAMSACQPIAVFGPPVALFISAE